MGSVGGLGALWIALAVALAGCALAGSLSARRHDREPGEWTVWLPVTIVLVALAFVLPWMLVRIAPEPARDTSADAPLQVPAWLFADGTALVAAIAAAVGAAAWVVCFLLRARLQHQQAREVDEAVLRELRGGTADKPTPTED